MIGGFLLKGGMKQRQLESTEDENIVPEEDVIVIEPEAPKVEQAVIY
jgi:hypothetical protein